MGKPVVLLYEGMHEKAVAWLAERAEVRMAPGLDEALLIPLLADVEGIVIRANGRVTRQMMQAAPRLKVVGRHGVGVEAIDRVAAAELGITVVNTPFSNDESVAEHCLGMMLALGKRLLEADRALRLGDWEARYRLIGVELEGKTLGLIGFGKIGQRLARMAHFGLGMPILYHDVVAYPDVGQALEAQHRTFEDVLRESDVVSVHVPLIKETHGLIDEAALRRMKPSAFLINSSRGPVVDPAALLRALQEGWIAGAGLDVFDPEPLPGGDPLLSLENVVVSPHMAAHTEEGLYRMAQVVEDVMAVIEGRAPTYPVPPPG
jgi:D-3-phosphoglycerate dehydrogenase